MELTPPEISKKYGTLFSKSLVTLVDERNKIVEIVEKCRARGFAEWDLANRLRASNLAYEGWVTGKTLILRARVGKSDVKLGPASSISGSQALEEVKIRDNYVYTTWCGISDIGIDVTACLPQARGVIKAIYPAADECNRTNSRTVKKVTIVTPKYSKLIVGIDDTDAKNKGATWLHALRAALNLTKEMKKLIILSHRIFQSYPRVPWKTAHNVSTVLVLGVPPTVSVSDVINRLVDEFKKNVFSNEACAVFYNGILIPNAIRSFGEKVKSEVVDELEAIKLARDLGFLVAEITGRKGVIGALAGIAYYDAGIECVSFPNDPALSKIRKDMIP